MIESFGKKKESFEEQWKHPEKLVFSGETMEVYDISPEHQKTTVPTVVVPGWSGTPNVHMGNIEALVKKGRRTISANAPHGVDFNKEEYPLGIDIIPDAELRKIATIIEVIKKKGIEEVDAVGHSQGCMDIVLAATLYPEYFRNIVLVNPAGMIGEDNFFRLVASFSVDVVRGYVDEIRTKGLTKPMLRQIRGMISSIATDPVSSFRQVLAISDAQIHDLLASIKKQGIGISVVSAVDDEVFSSARMQKIVTKEMVDGFYSVRGKHFKFQVDADPYTELVEGALSAMEKKLKN